jgi:hypothetical protein
MSGRAKARRTAGAKRYFRALKLFEDILDNSARFMWVLFTRR